MKKIVVGLVVVGVCVGLLFMIQNKKTQHTTLYSVGILQTASHPALDAVVQGFQEELKSLLGDDVSCIVKNAEGSIISAQTIAQQFARDDQFDLFFTIATPAVQAMYAVEKERPIVFAAVTDPKALGLTNTGTNVCGVTDMIDVSAEVAMLKALVPNAKTVGLLYTTGETNSLVLVELMKKELTAAGLTSTDFAVSGESDMQAVVELACRKSDLLLAPTDNTIASTIALVSMLAKNNKKPLIVSDNMLVSSGALAAQGVDYKESGVQAAQQAEKLLKGLAIVADLSIEQAKSEKIFINESVLKQLELTVPQDLQHNVIMIS